MTSASTRSGMRSLRWSASCTALLLSLTSCGDDGGAGPVCTAGEVGWCACGGSAAPGTQTCTSDGMSWGACDCSATPCDPGAVQWCACAGSPDPGTRTCTGDATGWGACDCPEIPVTDCQSSAQCTYPEGVCDPVSGTCVECLALTDCGAKPGTVCSLGACVCPEPDEGFCPADLTAGDRCVDLNHSPSDCGTCGHACYGACAAGACVDAWEPVPTAAAPAGRADHVAVSTGTQMIIWGGRDDTGELGDGARFDLATHAWTAMSAANAPSPRSHAAAIWTGTQMIIWGGLAAGSPLGDGASYDPALDTWTALPLTAAPSARHAHSMIWAGPPVNRLVVWGGWSFSVVADGATWSESTGWLSLPPGPSARMNHSAVWNDLNEQMIVFGGFGFDTSSGTDTTLTSPWELSPLPGEENWTALPEAGSPPAPRTQHTAVWTGLTMIVWGGTNAALGLLNDGALMNDSLVWLPLSGLAPASRRRHTATFVPSMERMVVWGGFGAADGVRDDGGVLDVGTATWLEAGLPRAPAGAVYHTAVVVGDQVIVWGGLTADGSYANTGGILDLTKIP